MIACSASDERAGADTEGGRGPRPARQASTIAARAVEGAARRRTHLAISSAHRTIEAIPIVAAHWTGSSDAVPKASCQERDLDDEHLQDGGQPQGAPQPPVGEQPAERPGVLGAGVQRVEQLGEHQGGEPGGTGDPRESVPATAPPGGKVSMVKRVARPRQADQQIPDHIARSLIRPPGGGAAGPSRRRSRGRPPSPAPGQSLSRG